MRRAPCRDKANVKKGAWSPEEDAAPKAYIHQLGTGDNWISLPQKIGLKRCGKSFRLRWLNYLRPNLKHGGFSEEEDSIICSLYTSIGSRWSIIAAKLPGRTDNDIKNYWNTRLKNKFLGRCSRQLQGYNENPDHYNPLMQPGDAQIFEQYQPSVIPESDGGKQPKHKEFHPISTTFQSEIDEFLMNNNQIVDFDRFKEADSSKIRFGH